MWKHPTGDGLQTLRSGFDSYTRSSELFYLKIEESYTFMRISWAEMSRNLEISFKCSVKAIENTTLCKLHKVSKGFKPMESNTLTYWPTFSPVPSNSPWSLCES